MRDTIELPRARPTLLPPLPPVAIPFGLSSVLGPRSSRAPLAWHVALWGLLAAASALLLLLPDLPVAGSNPLLAVALATMAGVIGLSLLLLGTLRYLIFGRPNDLYVGLGFGVLAVVNLLVGVHEAAWPLPLLTAPTGAYLSLGAHMLSALLFLLGLIQARVVVPPARRRAGAWRVGGALTATSMLVGVAIALLRDSLPDLIAAESRQVLTEGAPIFGVLPGQSSLLLMAEGGIALVLLLAAVGHVALARRLDDPHVGWIAAALTLLFFGELSAFLFPPVAPGYVSGGDLFRQGAYLALLFGLVTRLSGEIAEHASRDERLRLSRELHDGLAQQLGLLHLRLNRALSPGRSPAACQHDLEAAKRLVEAASLEARQAITTLRTGAVPWADFVRTVGTFADEFALNHDVQARLTAHGSAPAVDADLQAEVLRIAHEAFSNAVRHGRAVHLDVALSAAAGWLEVAIRDDGSGFAPPLALAGTGLGLRSLSERLERRGGALSLESAAGRGASVRARLPLGR